MVRVQVLRFTMLLGLKARHACDPFARVSGVHFLTSVTIIYNVKHGR
jgi:hypothetical protein